MNDTSRPCPSCGGRLWRNLFEHRDRLYGVPGRFTVITCEGCGLISYEPFPDASTLATYYPRDYYAHHVPPEAEPSGLRRLLDDLHLGLRHPSPLNTFLRFALLPLLWFKEVYSYARYLRPLSRGRLLDVGCGDGAFLIKARRMGFTVHGLEPWGNAARLVALGIPVETCPLADLRGFDGAFDVITLNHVFEHLPDPEADLRRLAAMLAPGGRLLLRLPRADHFLFRHLPRHWYGLDTPRHLFIPTPANLAPLARRCGLRITGIVDELQPTTLQHALKSIVFKKDFGTPHWLDHTAVSIFLLPAAAMLRRCGWADQMAVWLSREGDAPR